MYHNHVCGNFCEKFSWTHTALNICHSRNNDILLLWCMCNRLTTKISWITVQMKLTILSTLVWALNDCLAWSRSLDTVNTGSIGYSIMYELHVLLSSTYTYLVASHIHLETGVAEILRGYKLILRLTIEIVISSNRSYKGWLGYSVRHSGHYSSVAQRRASECPQSLQSGRHRNKRRHAHNTDWLSINWKFKDESNRRTNFEAFQSREFRGCADSELLGM